MDELKVQGPFFRGLVGKTLTKKLYKKFGIKTFISLNDFQYSNDGEPNDHYKNHVHLDIDVFMSDEDLRKFVDLVRKRES